jgi:hypothetical protein
VVACGAYDELKIMNINGNVINSGVEVHAMFGVTNNTYVNTVTQNYEPVVEQIKVAKAFSFLDEATQPYIYDITTGTTVRLSKTGEDPHGIMIPYDFRYPKEKICIGGTNSNNCAYPEFNDWGNGKITSTYWYKHPNESKVF